MMVAMVVSCSDHELTLANRHRHCQTNCAWWTSGTGALARCQQWYLWTVL